MWKLVYQSNTLKMSTIKKCLMNLENQMNKQISNCVMVCGAVLEVL